MKDKLFGILNTIITFGAWLYLGARSAYVADRWFGSFWGILVALFCILLAFVMQILLHEAGHLVAGLMTGYRFVSFRVGSFILLKNKEGKLALKRMTIPGTGGQCLLCPPEVPAEVCPYKLYHLMGGLTNLAFGLLGLVFVLILPTGMLNFCLFETTAVLGFMLGMTNLIPAKMNGMQNDGYNLLDLGRNPFARKALYLVLTLNARITVADSYEDLPEELVAELLAIDFTKEDLSNSSIANAYNYQAALFYAKGEYEKSYEVQKNIAENEKILEIFRNEAKCECLFYEILHDAGATVIEARYDKSLQKYIKATALYPSRQRLLYCYYKLYKKDEKNAAECMEKLERMIDTYSVKADAVLELKIAKSIGNQNMERESR